MDPNLRIWRCHGIVVFVALMHFDGGVRWSGSVTHQSTVQTLDEKNRPPQNVSGVSNTSERRRHVLCPGSLFLFRWSVLERPV